LIFFFILFFCFRPAASAFQLFSSEAGLGLFRLLPLAFCLLYGNL
jgi:hypothetical protein